MENRIGDGTRLERGMNGEWRMRIGDMNNG